MQNKSSKTIFTTVSIDKETGGLVEKICKRYSLKKAEVVKLPCLYTEKPVLLLPLFAEKSGSSKTGFSVYRQGKYQSRRCPRIGKSRTCKD